MNRFRISMTIGFAFVLGGAFGLALPVLAQQESPPIQDRSVKGLRAIAMGGDNDFVGCPEGGDVVYVFQVDVENTSERHIDALLDVEVKDSRGRIHSNYGGKSVVVLMYPRSELKLRHFVVPIIVHDVSPGDLLTADIYLKPRKRPLERVHQWHLKKLPTKPSWEE